MKNNIEGYTNIIKQPIHDLEKIPTLHTIILNYFKNLASSKG